MAGRDHRVTAPDLEQFVVATVQLTGNILGVGAYGSVEEVEIPGARVAAKKLHPGLVNLGSSQQVEKWVTDFVEESKLMSQLRHPHIVQFLGVCYLPDSHLPVLLMEKLQTSLDSLLENTPNIPFNVKVHLLTGTGQGVVYLHSRTPPIAHRDLTARNILVDNGLNAKITDMGVAKIVNICSDQTITMSNVPGNGLYMPPETMQEEGAARYNIAIDIFSFGVVSLFTLTQTFPKSPKPATYHDPITCRLVARSEIERREHYIEPMKADFGKTHPLVQLTLDCLEYLPENRPSAVMVLKQLEEVGTTVPHIKTKLELIVGLEEAVQQATEKQTENNQLWQALEEKDAQNDQLQQALAEKDAQNVRLTAANDCLQATCFSLQAEKKKQVCGPEKLSILQQEQLDVLHTGINQFSLKTQPQRSGQRNAYVSVATPWKPPVAPSSIIFDWRRCEDRVQDMEVYGQPMVIGGRLYSKGWSNNTYTVLVYTPDQDNWDELPSPPVENFSIATLREQFLLVGGRDKSTGQKSDKILSFDNCSQHWQQSLSTMPKKLSPVAVVQYQDHLIIAGGFDLIDDYMVDVKILHTTSNKWITAESLPKADYYHTALCGEFLYLIGRDTKTVLQAHVPSLISQVFGVWKSLLNVPYYHSVPVTIGNSLFTVGGCEGTGALRGSVISDIHCYDPLKKQWTKVGDLPLPIFDCSCIELSGKLYILGGRRSVLRNVKSVFVCTTLLI